jgi:hypothetical protein
MIVALMILIVLILLFGAAAVKGWIGSIAATVLSGVAIVLVFTLTTIAVGKDNVDILIGVVIGALLIVGIWAKIAEREAQSARPSEPPTARSISEARQARIKQEHLAMFRNPTYLSKLEKKRRKDDYKRDQP